MQKFTRLLERYDSLDVSGSQGAADQAVKTGQNAINSFDPTQKAGAQQAKTMNLGGQLAGQTNQYIEDYTKAVANNPSVTSLYNTANNMFNVPQLATEATTLHNKLNNTIPSAYRGARGFDIDSTDINNGIAQSQAYLTPQANAATANYNTAAGLASNFVQAGQAQNALNLLPVQAEAPLLAQSEAAQATGWNNAAQSEFEGLIQKMNAGVQLSATEMARANALSQQEEAYQQAIATANIGNKYLTVPNGSNLINTFANTAINPAIATSQSRQGVASYG